MHKLKISALVTIAFLLVGCGDTKSTSPDSEPKNSTHEFTYQTQRSVDVNILIGLNELTQQKQILLYELQKSVDTPVGEQTILDGLFIDGVINNKGEFTTTLTLGNHINSIWVHIPSLSYQQEHNISDSKLNITIEEGN